MQLQPDAAGAACGLRSAAACGLNRPCEAARRRTLRFLPLPPLLLLAMLMQACHAAGVALPTRKPPDLHQHCPAWLREYIHFHKSMKFHPDAKYLVYDCTSIGCLGLGDRLRGMVWMMRYAAFSKRVFLVRMTAPMNIENYFQPTWIDWRVNVVGPNNKTLDIPPSDQLRDLPMWNDELIADFGKFYRRINDNTNKWVGGRTNIEEQYPEPVSHPVGRLSRNASCIIQSLFMASEEAEIFVSRHYASMQVNPTRPYLAIHLRLFQMVGEGEENAHHLRHEDMVLKAILGVRDMAPKCGVDLATNPAVLVTDGLHIRRRVSLQLYNQLTTAPIQPHHFETSEQGPKAHDRHMETIADFIVMSRAAGIFYDYKSGFSRMAAYLGGHALSETNVPNPCLVLSNMVDAWAGLLDYKIKVRDIGTTSGQPLPGVIYKRMKKM